MQKEQKQKQDLLDNLNKIEGDIDIIQYTITSLLDDDVVSENKEMIE